MSFCFAENVSAKQMRSIIEDTVTFWNEMFASCILWLPRHEENDYVIFIAGAKCYSEIGRTKKEQVISLNEVNCKDRGSILHEMLHTLGLSHEHNRLDRDEYIKIHFLNIPYGWRQAYEKDAFWNFGRRLGPYDYYSIMHYEIESPDRKKPAFTILKKGIDSSRIGQRKVLSEIDKLKVRKLYCPSCKEKNEK